MRGGRARPGEVWEESQHQAAREGEALSSPGRGDLCADGEVGLGVFGPCHWLGVVLTSLPPSMQGHILPGLPVHQVWCRGTQGVSGGDASLQDQ